jgi:hypothetical protein
MLRLAVLVLLVAVCCCSSHAASLWMLQLLLPLLS